MNITALDDFVRWEVTPNPFYGNMSPVMYDYIYDYDYDTNGLYYEMSRNTKITIPESTKRSSIGVRDEYNKIETELKKLMNPPTDYKLSNISVAYGKIKRLMPYVNQGFLYTALTILSSPTKFRDLNKTIICANLLNLYIKGPFDLDIVETNTNNAVYYYIYGLYNRREDIISSSYQNWRTNTQTAMGGLYTALSMLQLLQTDDDGTFKQSITEWLLNDTQLGFTGDDVTVLNNIIKKNPNLQNMLDLFPDKVDCKKLCKQDSQCGPGNPTCPLGKVYVDKMGFKRSLSRVCKDKKQLSTCWKSKSLF